MVPDASVSQHRMHPVLTGGRQPDQGRPVTQQGPQITDLLGAIQAPGNKISPQQ